MENTLRQIEVILGDITNQTTDAIVNAANTTLSGGGGVDGAIHSAAGPKLAEACRAIGYCRTGEAVVTLAFNLKSKYIIHAVGPVWQGGNNHEAELLASCYRNSLELSVRRGIKTIAFPALSTGAYGYPPEQAAGIAVNEIKIFLSTHPEIEKIVFVCYTEETFRIYNSLI